MLGAACGKSDASAAAAPGGPGKPKGPVVVRTAPLHEERSDRVVEVTGTLAGAELVTLSAEVDGRVVRVAADLGDAVRAGAAVVQLDATTPRLLVEQAQAELEMALARVGADEASIDAKRPDDIAAVKRAQADLDEQTRNLGRISELRRRGVVTDNDVDTVATRQRVAAATLDQAREEAASAIAQAKGKRAALGLAKKRLSDTTITSPVAGVVAERMVSLGELVKAGQPVARIVVADTLKLRGEVPERYARDVKTGMPLAVDVESAGAAVAATVTRTAPAIDEASRTFRIEATVDNKELALKPGLFARARIVVDRDELVFALPETAVSSLAGVTKVFVLDGADGNKARERKVVVLRKRKSDALVAPATPGDLKDGDQVILTGIARLFDGADVKVDAEAASSSAAADAAAERTPPKASGAAEVDAGVAPSSSAASERPGTRG